MFTPGSASLPDCFCACREILSSVCPTRNGGLFLSTFRLQINKHTVAHISPPGRSCWLCYLLGSSWDFSRKPSSVHTKRGQI